MPLITITAAKGRTPEEKRAIGDAVHKALIVSGVPDADRFQRFFDLEPENFIYDTHYPDLTEGRTEAFTIIEILLSVGRSVKVKRSILEKLIEGLELLHIAPKDVFVCFKETAWENWSFANGKLLHT
jgi:phenylpyruvate tautomerase PptA (4-oxalocrotonate tautomerase family)